MQDFDKGMSFLCMGMQQNESRLPPTLWRLSFCVKRLAKNDCAHTDPSQPMSIRCKGMSISWKGMSISWRGMSISWKGTSISNKALTSAPSAVPFRQQPLALRWTLLA